MEPTYIVAPLSALNIELDSSFFLRNYQPNVLKGKAPLNIEILFDNIFQDKGFSLQLIPDNEFPRAILGLSEMDNKIIKIRESDYLSCETEGYPRMTMAHEVGHSRLHSTQFEQNGMKMYRTQSNHIPSFISAEWQARVWASATLMPFQAMTQIIANIPEKDRISVIMKKFIVSKSAAEVRLNTLNTYLNDGRYNKIESAMKEKGLI